MTGKRCEQSALNTNAWGARYRPLTGIFRTAAELPTQPPRSTPGLPRVGFIQLLILLTTIPALVGCAGYRIGNDTLYRPDIRTVYVPVFQSESFRRHLGERLTEAVVKEIQLTTPYKVVPADAADSILQGRIFEEKKYSITTNVNDIPRDIELDMLVEVAWRGRGGQTLSGPATFRLPSGFDRVAQAVHIAPEGGQSISTGQQELFIRIAKQIVANMEVAW